MTTDIIPKRSPSEVLKRGYSDDEVRHIYELGRFHLENGRLRKAAIVFSGVTMVAPGYTPAWLGMAYIEILKGDFEKGLLFSQKACKLDPASTAAMLYTIACYLNLEDYTSAGALLGECADRIEEGQVTNSNEVRFFRAQFSRYQSRSTLVAD